MMRSAALARCQPAPPPPHCPRQALSFDFANAANSVQSAELRFRVTRAGVLSAVAFWFDLQLDEQATLSTSPYGALRLPRPRPPVHSLKLHLVHGGMHCHAFAAREHWSYMCHQCPILLRHFCPRPPCPSRRTSLRPPSQRACMPVPVGQSRGRAHRPPLTPAYAGPKGRTWQQALQYLEEAHVRAGEEVCVTARHDTYGISFSVERIGHGTASSVCAGGSAADHAAEGCGGGSHGSSAGGGAPAGGAEGGSPEGEGLAAAAGRKTGVPLWDPAWRECYQAMGRVHDQVARGATHDPLEYRAYCAAAATMAAQPERFDLDADAVDVCARFLS